MGDLFSYKIIILKLGQFGNAAYFSLTPRSDQRLKLEHIGSIPVGGSTLDEVRDESLQLLGNSDEITKMIIRWLSRFPTE